MNEETIKEIARLAWMGAANAFRMYPNQKHTFVDWWDLSKNAFKEFESTVEEEIKRHSDTWDAAHAHGAQMMRKENTGGRIEVTATGKKEYLKSLENKLRNQ